MPQVDFYLLKADKPQARYPLLCRLIDKAYQRKHQVYIHAESVQQAQIIDEQLWTFKDNSFIPHNLCDEKAVPPPPIQIGYADKNNACRDIMINLAEDIPPFYERFSRVIEMIVEDEQLKKIGREHYRFYREKACTMKTHEI